MRSKSVSKSIESAFQQRPNTPVCSGHGDSSSAHPTGRGSSFQKWRDTFRTPSLPCERHRLLQQAHDTRQRTIVHSPQTKQRLVPNDHIQLGIELILRCVGLDELVQLFVENEEFFFSLYRPPGTSNQRHVEYLSSSSCTTRCSSHILANDTTMVYTNATSSVLTELCLSGASNRREAELWNPGTLTLTHGEDHLRPDNVATAHLAHDVFLVRTLPVDSNLEKAREMNLHQPAQ